MKKSILLAATAVVGAGVAFQGSVNLQPTTPGTPQTGHLNITGTAKAGSMVGYNNTPTGQTFGGDFRVTSNEGRGILGNASSLTGATYGGLFQSASNAGRGIAGIATRPTGNTYGGFFSSLSVDGKGVYGQTTAATGTNYGVYGKAVSAAGFGVFSEGNLSATGVISGNGSGLSSLNADSMSTGTLADGRLSNNVPLLNAANDFGPSINTFAGRVSIGTAAPGSDRQLEIIASPGLFKGLFVRCPQPGGDGVYGEVTGSSASGVRGHAYDTGFATYGVSGSADGNSGLGVAGYHLGASGQGIGVYGSSASAGGRGVFGYVANGTSNSAVQGVSAASNGNGIIGEATVGSSAYAIWGKAPQGVGVLCNGALQVTGNKMFRIDHPFDPENKYLQHYCSEGPEPLNVYRGNVVTDARGYATIALPDYFEEINRDPSYQLTVIDRSDDFILAKVIAETKDNAFTIRTSKSNVRVSWRVEGVRNDRYVRHYGAPVEVDKTDKDRGTYQHPELYGLPKERGFGYVSENVRPISPRR